MLDSEAIATLLTKNAETIYERGLCDGLEVAARLVETALTHPVADRRCFEVLLTVIREAQLHLQVDGI
jgi:hypothetical protein